MALRAEGANIFEGEILVARCLTSASALKVVTGTDAAKFASDICDCMNKKTTPKKTTPTKAPAKKAATKKAPARKVTTRRKPAAKK